MIPSSCCGMFEMGEAWEQASLWHASCIQGLEPMATAYMGLVSVIAGSSTSQMAYWQGPRIVVAWARLVLFTQRMIPHPLYACRCRQTAFSMLLLTTAETKGSQPRSAVGMRPWLIDL